MGTAVDGAPEDIPARLGPPDWWLGREGERRRDLDGKRGATRGVRGRRTTVAVDGGDDGIFSHPVAVDEDEAVAAVVDMDCRAVAMHVAGGLSFRRSTLVHHPPN